MKKIIYYFSTLLLVVSVSACTGFLDKEIDLSISEEGVFSNADNTRMFLANIYTNLPDVFQGFGNDQYTGASRDCMTDNAISYWNVHYYNSVLNDGFSALDHPFSVGAPGATSFYINDVDGIRKCNQFLKNARSTVIGNTESSDDNNRLYDRNMAEAKLLRAILHFDLTEWFGPCPIIAEDENGVPIVFDLGNPGQMNMSRTAPAEAYKWIADQCDEVKDKLPFRYANEAENWGRVNGATAYALKARALLYRASPLNNSGNNTAWWAEAAQAAKDFIAKNSAQVNPYKLFTLAGSNQNYYECFVANPVYNNEYILSRSVWNTTEIERQCTPIGFSGQLISVGRTNPTQNLVDSYEMKDGKPIYDPITGAKHPDYNPADPYTDRDPRLDQTIFHHNSVWGDKKNEEERKIDVSSPSGSDYQALHGGTLTGYYMKKFIANISFKSPTNVQHACPVFRYAEILLNAAEAINESEGPANAYQYVNEVRARAGMPAYNGMSKEQLRERLRNERRVELCFEDHRWHDARRWKLYDEQTASGELSMPYYKQLRHLYGVKVTDAENPKYSFGLAETRNALKFNSPKNYYLPLPDSEVKRAPNLKQNPGWELSASSSD